MKKLLVYAMGIVPLLAGAGNYDVPSGDLAAPATWGAGGMPTGSDVIIFRSIAGGPRLYTLSADTNLTAYAITSSETSGWTEKGVTFDFSNGNHTLSLPHGFGMRNQRSHVTFRGGTWDLGSVKLWLTDDQSYMMEGATTLVDHVTFKCGELNLLNYYSNSRTVISNKSTVIASGDGYFGRHSPKTCHGRIEFLDGTDIRVAGKTYLGHNTYYSDTAPEDHDLTLRVAGEGTKLTMSTSGNNETWIGYGLAGNTMVVEDHAQVNAYQFIVGQGGNARSNKLVVKGGASVRTAASLEMARWSDAGQGNRIEVLDAGELAVGTNSTTSTLFVGNTGHDNALYVSNATVSCGAPIVGNDATSNGNVAEVRGPESRLTLKKTSGTWALFGKGSENKWIFADHFTNSYPRSIVFSDNCANKNAVTVKDGACFGTADEFYMGSASIENEGSRLEVLNGATVSVANGLYMRGESPVVSVSNATLAIGSNPASSKYLQLGYASGNVPCTNATLVLSGEHPSVTNANGRLVVMLVEGKKANLRIELPENSVYEFPPIVCNQFQLFEDSTVTIANADKLLKNLTKPVDIPLIFADDGIKCGHNWLLANDQALLKKINATLPPRCSCWFSPTTKDSGNSGMIYLRMRPERGLMVIVR